MINGKADKNRNQVDGGCLTADHWLLLTGYAAQHKPDGARHGETTGGEPGKRKKQAGACSFQRMQADCG